MTNDSSYKPHHHSNKHTILGRVVLIAALLLTAAPFTHAVQAQQFSSSDTREQLINASYAGVVPTHVHDDVADALLGGASPVRFPIADGVSDAFGVSNGVLLYRVGEDLFQLDLRTGLRTRLLPDVLVVTAAWQPMTNRFAAVVRTPGDFGLVVADAATGRVDVIEKANVRPDAIRWTIDGTELYYVLTRGDRSLLEMYGDAAEHRPAFIDESAVTGFLDLSDDDLRSHQVMPRNESERGSPRVIARSIDGFFAASGDNILFYAGGNVASSNAVVVNELKTTTLALPASFGNYLGEFNKVAIYSNGYSSFGDGPKNYVGGVYTGIQYQCVEFVQRYYWLVYGLDLASKRRGNANDFYVNAAARNLDAFPNGGSTPPEVGDIAVSEGSEFGHVGIVREVNASTVCFANQNWSNTGSDARKCVGYTQSGSKYTVSGFNATFPVRGWLRRRGAGSSGGGSGTAARMQSPAPGTTLSGSTQTFTWSAGAGVSQYVLYVGANVGSNEYYAANAGLATSTTVSNLPTDGRTLYVRLWSLVGGTWQVSDYQYRAASSSGGGGGGSTSAPSQIQSPSPGSTLSGSSQTFAWSGVNVAESLFYIGNATGANDIYGANVGTRTSITVNNLPTDGRTLYVRLWSRIGSNWYSYDYKYYAAHTSGGGGSTSAPAQIQSPSPGSTLSGSSQTFAWSGVNVAESLFYIGNATGANDIYGANVGTRTSITVNNLPTDGRTLYVRLWSRIGSNWYSYDYKYYAAHTSGGGGSTPAPAQMQSPSPGSTLSGSSQSFSWSGGVGVDEYFVYVGNATGANDIYGASAGTRTSITVNNLPTDGRTLYVRLWSHIGGSWYTFDYKYYAARTSSGGGGGSAMPAQIVTPAPGTTLSSTQTFTWTTGSGVGQYFFYLGTTAGSNNLYGGSTGTSTSITLSNIPATGGSLYVRLWSNINGTWTWNDYQYRAPR